MDTIMGLKTKDTGRRRARRKKKMASQSPPPPKKSAEIPSPLKRQREEMKERAAEELKRAVGKVVMVITRKRMPLFDLLQNTSGAGVSGVTGFTKDLLAQQDMSHEDVDCLVEWAMETCSATRNGFEVIDVKKFERECRDYGRGRKALVGLGAGVGTSQNREGGIRTKSKAQEVYGGFAFSFQGEEKVGGEGCAVVAGEGGIWNALGYGEERDKENAAPEGGEEDEGEKEEKGEGEKEEGGEENQWWDSYLGGNDSFSGDVKDMQREEMELALGELQQEGGGEEVAEKGNGKVVKGSKWLTQFDKRMSAALAKGEEI